MMKRLPQITLLTVVFVNKYFSIQGTHFKKIETLINHQIIYFKCSLMFELCLFHLLVILIPKDAKIYCSCIKPHPLNTIRRLICIHAEGCSSPVNFCNTCLQSPLQTLPPIQLMMRLKQQRKKCTLNEFL